MAAVLNQVAGAAMNAAGVTRQWSSGLCDCTRETQSCLDVVFCSPCQVARQCNAVDGQTNMNDGCLCCLSLIMMYYGNGGMGILAMLLRYRLIAKYSITGEGVISTFFNAICCPPCSLCQTHRELTAIGIWPGGTCCGTAGPIPMK